MGPPFQPQGVFVEGLSEWVVRSPAEIYGLMERGGTMRATGSTKMNEMSSRSHAVFIIIAEQSETTYLDEAGAEMSPEDFHKLVKSRAHGEHGQKILEVCVCVCVCVLECVCVCVCVCVVCVMTVASPIRPSLCVSISPDQRAPKLQSGQTEPGGPCGE